MLSQLCSVYFEEPERGYSVFFDRRSQGVRQELTTQADAKVWYVVCNCLANHRLYFDKVGVFFIFANMLQSAHSENGVILSWVRNWIIIDFNGLIGNIVILHDFAKISWRVIPTEL